MINRWGILLCVFVFCWVAGTQVWAAGPGTDRFAQVDLIYRERPEPVLIPMRMGTGIIPPLSLETVYDERAKPQRLSPDTIPGYPCYHTINEMDRQLDQWAMAYPDIVNLILIGDSFAARPLRVLHLTNARINDGEKPVFFLMAGIHGDEVISSEAAMAFAQYLLGNYSHDPDVTWLLDEHNIYVLLSANPDGHVKNEGGEPWVSWRKNVNPSNGECDQGHYGIDLNRNFAFKWGGAGSDSDPCSWQYRGPAAVSEYETQALYSFMLSVFQDQRGPDDTDAASLDATGLFVSLHSYGNLVLWPWGYTRTEAPNETHLGILGRKFASFTGYIPQQAYYLYTTSGTADDWVYGELGVAAYTFEIGSSAEGRYPPCARYDELIQPNVEALLYAAKVARAPYLTPSGPDVLSIASRPTWTLQGPYIEVNTTIEMGDWVGDAGQNLSILSTSPIVQVEAYVDVPPWRGGTPYQLAAADGALDAPKEIAQGRVPISGSVASMLERHIVFVRARNAGGYWGPMSADFVTPTLSTLMPAVATQSGLPGTYVPYTLTLSNISQLTHTFHITQSVSNWPTTVVPTRVQDLSPLGYETVIVTVTIPANQESLLLASSDRVTVTVVPEHTLPASLASAVLTTHLRTEVHVFLPLVMKMSHGSIPSATIKSKTSNLGRR